MWLRQTSLAWLFSLFIYCLSSSLAVSLADEQGPLLDIDPYLLNANVQDGAKAALVCIGCHSSEPGAPDKIGPGLWGVVNRPIASWPNYQYSAALSGRDGVWDYNTINRFLLDPADFVPGTTMTFPGLADDLTRINIIAWLRTLSASPVALPTVAPKHLSLDGQADRYGADWPAGEMRDTVGATCSVCHSLAIVKQQGLSRADWDELLDWMTEEQGMDPINEPERTGIVDYLARHFGIR